MAGEALLQTRLGGGIRSRYHSGGRAEPSGLMDTPPQGALPRFGGFGLCRPAADVQLGAGGIDFPVLGKTLEERKGRKTEVGRNLGSGFGRTLGRGEVGKRK